VYLTYYQFDKNMLIDTCKQIKNGKIIFKGKNKLDKGIYSLVGQSKTIYFDFLLMKILKISSLKVMHLQTLHQH